MQLILTGKAPVRVLKDLDIISEKVAAPDDTISPFSASFFSTRTSSSTRDVLEILKFNEEDITSYSLTHDSITEGQLFLLEEVLEVAGEPSDLEALKTLLDARAEFTGFIAFFE